MWVFCCGMFRSASTLQFQITSRLVKDAGIGYQVGWIDWKRFGEVKAANARHDGLKVVKVHVCGDAIAQEFHQNNAKGIYIFRDVRDVYASYLKQRQKPFEFLWNEGFLETCLEAYQRWTSLPNVLISKYDEVMTNPAQEVLRIAEHLEIAIASERAKQIADEYAFEQQRQRIEKFKTQLLQTVAARQDSDRELVDYHDEESLLHMNHISSGKIGQWQQELQAEEANLIEKTVQEWCRKNDLPASIFLD